MKQILKTRLLVLALSLMALAHPGSGQAATYPEGPVKIVIPYAPGGLTDILARALATELAKAWQQPVIVENKPGASGAIAASQVAKSKPDGLTLLFANDTALSVNQYLYKKLSYHPEKDFRAVHNVAGSRNVVLASKASGFQTLADVLAQARQRPGAITYGSFGIGTSPHLLLEDLAGRAGVKLNHVPYKGNSETVNALLGGHIDLTVVAIPTVMPLLGSDKVSLLALIAPERHATLPGVPTVAEAGVSGLDGQIYFGLVAPIQTPDAVVRRISDAVSRVIRQPDFQKTYLGSKGMDLIDQGPADFEAFLKADREKYARRIQAMQLSLD